MRSRIYKGSMKVYKCSMSPFKTLVMTNEITVFVTSRIYIIITVILLYVMGGD